MRHVKIIERLAGGPRYEDPNLAFRPRGRASRTLAGSTRQAWCRSRCVIGSPWQPARVPAVLYVLAKSRFDLDDAQDEM